VRRPNTILGLSLRALRVHPGCVAAVVVTLLAALCVFLAPILPGADARDARVAFGTFNIENFPKHRRQAAGAFDAIASLDARFVAVQEIVDPRTFAREASRRLGPEWRFVSSDTSLHGERPTQHVGLLFDSEHVRVEYARTRTETQYGDGRGKPCLEVRLRTAARTLRVFVVHLKSGGAHFERRRGQLLRLEPVLAEALAGGDDVVVLGDFNATGDEDRALLRAMSARLGLDWASEGLECTAYWRRRDGCLGSQLDHVLARPAHTTIRARGACETAGCAPGDRCPVFRDEVSDHCPLSASF